MKVLFLDIDGVLNTHTTAIMYGNVFIMTPDVSKKLDPHGMRLIRFLIANNVNIVLSSTWRMGQSVESLNKTLNFKIIDKTGPYSKNGDTRGYEINDWLDKHPEVTDYCILDDDEDMLPEQIPYFVHVNGITGLNFDNIVKICDIFKIDPMTIKKMEIT